MTTATSNKVKALTIWQPWASLIAAGIKQYETRGWTTSYRGLIAIHAAKRTVDTQPRQLLREPRDIAKLPQELPLGAVVALARLVDVVPSEQLMARPGFADSQERRLGDFSPGRYGWKLEIVEVYDPPLSAKGKQGLWSWEPPQSPSKPQPSSKTKRAIPLALARKAAQKLLAQLEPHCERIEIAGSIRREKEEIGDIELVAIPKMGERMANVQPPAQQLNLFGGAPAAGGTLTEKYSRLDEELTRLVEAGMLLRTPPRGVQARTAWGPRQKKLWMGLNEKLGFIQVDLFIATVSNWGAIFTIRTGSSDFSNALVAYIKNRTPYRQGGGSLTYSPTGEVVSTPTERSYFEHIGVPWVKPHLRDARAAQHLLRYQWPERVLLGMGYTDAAARAMMRQRLSTGVL